MKYFKIVDKSIDIERHIGGVVADIPSANGEFVPNGKFYFDRMGKGEIITDAPVFDYFHLQSYGKHEDWEWRLQDVHAFIGEYPTGGHWYISDYCKSIFEQFVIAKGYHFYPTKLLYKGKKLDYWIFQYGADDNGLNHKLYINYAKSVFYDESKNMPVSISNYNEFKALRDKIGSASDYEKDLIAKQLVFNQNVDFIPLFGISSGIVVSNKLKLAIEKAGLEGFVFSELLEYEIKVENG